MKRRKKPIVGEMMGKEHVLRGEPRQTKAKKSGEMKMCPAVTAHSQAERRYSARWKTKIMKKGRVDRCHEDFL